MIYIGDMITVEEKKIRHRKAALEHYRRNAEAIKARKRETYKARRGALTEAELEDRLDIGREASLRYYWKHRDRILAKKRKAREEGQR